MVSGQYFNKGVKALDSPHVGHVVRETDDKIVVFGGGDERYDIPKSAIRFVSGNVLIDLPFHEIVKSRCRQARTSRTLGRCPETLTWRPMKGSTQSRSLTKESGRRTRSTSAT
jgi:hypothetical protein